MEASEGEFPDLRLRAEFASDFDLFGDDAVCTLFANLFGHEGIKFLSPVETGIVESGNVLAKKFVGFVGREAMEDVVEDDFRTEGTDAGHGVESQALREVADADRGHVDGTVVAAEAEHVAVNLDFAVGQGGVEKVSGAANGDTQWRPRIGEIIKGGVEVASLKEVEAEIDEVAREGCCDVVEAIDPFAHLLEVDAGGGRTGDARFESRPDGLGEGHVFFGHERADATNDPGGALFARGDGERDITAVGVTDGGENALAMNFVEVHRDAVMRRERHGRIFVVAAANESDVDHAGIWAKHPNPAFDCLDQRQIVRFPHRALVGRLIRE